MAYQMIGWENAPSKKTPINDTNLKHMDKGIFDNDAAIASAKVDIKALKTEVQTLETKVETLAPKNFELYAISDTQPTIPIGESYYNTTSNKIFTNVDDRVYVDKGEPEAGMLYIIFSDQSTYAYNGTTLVSVGGGSGETITQQPTAPENPEENDLWIDTTNGNALKRYNGTSWELVSTSSDAPIGTITPFAGTTPPSDYLLCDGTAVSRTTYSDLFAVIGTTFGSGDGSTTFNLPNLKGRVPVGLDGTQTEFDTLGETGGEKAHILTVNEMPSHNHELKNGNTGTGAYAVQFHDTASGDTHPYITTFSTGGGQAHNILQPYIVVNYIIKATKTTPIQAKVVNTQSNSTTDTYGCSYINNKINDINNALNNVRNVNYYALGVNITPTKDCYAEVTVSAYGWGYDGVASALSIYKSGNPTIILESLGTTQGHNTVADNVTSFGIYRLNAGSTYSFNVGALSGSTGGQTGYVKTINI